VRNLSHLLFLAILLSLGNVAAQDSAPLPTGAKVYIAPMEWQLDGLIAAEIHRQNLPVNVVQQQTEADYVMTGSSEKLSSHMMSPGRCFQVTIVTANNGKPVWTGEADDYATVFGRLRTHGPNRAAKALVGSIRHRFFKKTR
jgi:hypothetical protein